MTVVAPADARRSFADHLDRDAPALALGALGVLAGALTSSLPMLVLAAAITWVGAARALPRGGLTAALAVGLLWSNAVVVVGADIGAPVIVGVTPQVLLLFVVLSRWVVERASIVSTAAFRMLLLYGAVLLLTGLTAEFSAPVLDVALEFFLEGPLLWLLVINVVDDAVVLRRVLVAMIVAVAMLGALSLVQYGTGTFDQDYLGFAGLAEDEAELLAADADYVPRQSGSIGEKNRYAQVLLITLPFAVALTRRRAGRATVVLLAAAVGIVAGIALSGSRGAALGLVVLVGVLLAYRVIAARSVVVIIATVAGVLLLLPSYRERVVSIVDAVGGVDDSPDEDGAVLGRVAENLAALEMFVDNPVVGVGPGGYAYQYEDYAQTIGFNIREGPREPHNLYLGLGSESGLLGLGAFVLVVSVLLAQLHGAWRAVRPVDRAQADLAAAAVGAIVAYLVTGVFLHLSYERYLWCLLAVADAVVRVTRARIAEAGAA